MASMRAMMQSVSLQEQYDENAKWLISQKPFLANILVRTVKEFEGLDPRGVEKIKEIMHISEDEAKWIVQSFEIHNS